MLMSRVSFAAFAVSVVCGAACAAGGGSTTQGAGAGSSSSASASTSASTGQGAGGTGQGAGGTGGDGGSIFDGGPKDGDIDPDASCGLLTKEAVVLPVSLYIAFDKSSSMVGEKWNASKAGLSAFVNDPASADIKVALNFFPLDNNPTCDQFAYKPPLVPYGPLPQNAPAITAAMSATSPTGFNTPIYPALGGAILAAKEQGDNNPGEASAVLLVTDGQPQGPANMCGGVNPEDPAVIANLAATGVTFGVKTFVIGLPGVNQAFANQVAAAGGTTSAILVGALNVQTEFQNALAKVKGEALPCEYEIPAEVEGGQVDYGFVNVLLTPQGGQATVLPQDPSCQAEGWKYDDPVNPKHIVFCAASCSALKKSVGGKVQILLGCQTEIAK